MFVFLYRPFASAGLGVEPRVRHLCRSVTNDGSPLSINNVTRRDVSIQRGSSFALPRRDLFCLRYGCLCNDIYSRFLVTPK